MKVKVKSTLRDKKLSLEIPAALSSMSPGTKSSLIASDGKRRSRFLRLTAVILFVILLATLTASGFWLQELGIFTINDQDIALLTTYKSNDMSLVFDKSGQKIGELYSQYRIYIPYDALPKDMIKAIIAIEDKKFFTHHGVDTSAIVRAIVSRIKGSSSRQGASTITQQVIRYFLLTQEHTFERKVREMALALFLEQRLTKRQIFEIYVNSCFLGNGAYGVGAAAKRYFNKNIGELTLGEAALIAGLFQSPSRYNPMKFPTQAKRRQKQVIAAMLHGKFIDRPTARKIASQPLVYSATEPSSNSVAPYFIDYVASEAEQILNVSAIRNQGLRIYTTLDADLQKLAGETISRAAPMFSRAEHDLPAAVHYLGDHSDAGESRVESGLIATDPRDGHILAMVGGRDYNASQFNVTYQAKRQPGSAFKPVVFSLALDNGFKWSDLLYISRIAIDDYRPQNFSNQFGTETSMLRAFYSSINTAAVEVGGKLGLKKILERAASLGIRSPLKEEAGTMLGGSEVTMLDMATMYGTFATLGTRTNLVAITRITDHDGRDLYVAPTPEQRSKAVLSPQTGYLMFQGMKAVLDYGTGARSRGISPWAAGKTGTSNNSKDNWFCGFTPNIVTIVWVGTDNKLGLAGSATGASMALPLWDGFMAKALALHASPAYEEPPGIVEHAVDPRYGNLDDNGIKMYFREGQEPRESKSDLKVISSTNAYRDMFD